MLRQTVHNSRRHDTQFTRLSVRLSVCCLLSASLHVGHLNKDSKKTSFPSRNAYRAALISVYLAYLSTRHQFTLRDHGYWASASRGVSVYVPAIVATLCAYTRMDGQVELTWVAWLHTEMVYPPADGHPSKY